MILDGMVRALLVLRSMSLAYQAMKYPDEFKAIEQGEGKYDEKVKVIVVRFRNPALESKSLRIRTQKAILRRQSSNVVC